MALSALSGEQLMQLLYPSTDPEPFTVTLHTAPPEPVARPAAGVVWCVECGGHHGVWPTGELFTPICDRTMDATGRAWLDRSIHRPMLWVEDPDHDHPMEGTTT